MKLRLLKLRDSLAGSFWFLPTVIAFFAAGAALGLVALDHLVGEAWVRNLGFIWSGGAEGARSVLSVVAGSVMTVVSIVFSLTITTLAQTSSHYGPRVLRNFISDRGVQMTLGVFIATFVYCLLVLRTVRSAEEEIFVPYLAVNVGVLLAVAALGVLIYFIHHVSQSIQVEHLVALVGRGFEDARPVLFPAHHVAPILHEAAPTESEWREAQIVCARQAGYVQRIDDARLMALATEFDLRIKIETRPGDFATVNAPLLRVLAPAPLAEATADALVACFSLGDHRTPFQDALYPLQQLVEIAAHALSPGINEPFTALACIDWLGNSLHAVANRDWESPERGDDAGRFRILARPVVFSEMIQTSCGQIREYACSSPTVMTGLFKMLAALGPTLQRPGDRESIRRQVQLIAEDAEQIRNPHDRARLQSLITDFLHSSFEPASPNTA